MNSFPSVGAPRTAFAAPIAEKLWRRAQQYIATKQLTAARIVLESLVQREPRQIAVRMLLSGVYLDAGQVRAAAAQAVAASTIVPDDPDTVATVVHCLLRLGEATAARDCLARFDPRKRRLSGSQLLTLAHAYQTLGDHQLGLALMDRAQQVGFDSPDFRYSHALQMQFNGKMEDARQRLGSCLELGPTHGRATLALSRMSRQTTTSNHLDYIDTQLSRVEPGSEDHAAFEFARYKELDDIGRYGEAFAALEQGNAIMYSRLRPDGARERELFEAIRTRVGPSLSSGPGAAVQRPTPIFIVGMPRSGTTLLDRLLDNHPDTVSTGERADFPRQLRWAANLHGNEPVDLPLLDRLPAIDFEELGRRYLEQTQWRAPNALFYVDKLPMNFMLAGLIHRALPHAPILHMVRDPMDVCFSNYKAMFGANYPYSYQQQALAAHYARYRALMQHWHDTMPGRILDVSYAELVRDPERKLTDVFAWCGMRQVPGCSDLTRNRTAVNTLSSAQVREPIHTRTLGEWQRYERQLEPLRGSLRDAGFDTAHP